ncbi:MAG TPA: DUF6089 family protein [Chitinophagaceae bacterium]|nr:DUF6089 family protein [Chitinophagaceae bacterium]
MRLVYYLLCSFLLIFCQPGQAQQEDISTYYTGELGVSGGSAEYFGDLNTSSSFKGLMPAVGVFYRYFFNQYVGLRLGVHFAQVGYSDALNTNPYEQRRNLSFNSNILEIAMQGDFNFFRFEPGTKYRFTPFITFGVGAFTFNPYAYYQGNKYYLQPLNTEGEGSTLYPNRKPYSLVALCFPIGAGFKYNINKQFNVSLEASNRLTTTDYLDDVSKTYVEPVALPGGQGTHTNISYILQDRSGATGAPIGVPGRQRGNSQNKDQYIIIEISLSYLFTQYRCPKF